MFSSIYDTDFFSIRWRRLWRNNNKGLCQTLKTTAVSTEYSIKELPRDGNTITITNNKNTYWNRGLAECIIGFLSSCRHYY